MKVGLSTSVIQRGRSGVAQYVFALVDALLRHPDRLDLSLFVLEEDAPLFDFARGLARIIPVSERFRSPVKNIIWHQTVLPRLARAEGLDVLHVPSYRRMMWRQPCALVTTIQDLAPFHVPGKYDWKRMFYGRVVARRLAHRQHRIIAVSQTTATDISRFFAVPCWISISYAWMVLSPTRVPFTSTAWPSLRLSKPAVHRASVATSITTSGFWRNCSCASSLSSRRVPPCISITASGLPSTPLILVRR